MMNRSRPCLIQALACIREPLLSEASTMTVAFDMAAIVTFRSEVLPL